MKDAEILFDQCFIVQDIMGAAVKHAAASVEDDGVVRNFQRYLKLASDMT